MKKLTLCLLVLLFACSFFIACNPSTSSNSLNSNGVNSSIEEDLSDSSAISGNTHDYTTFTASEKRLFQEYFGEVVIPFIANDEYYLEEYLLDNEDGTYEEGLNFYTVGNSGTEFESYLELFSVFTKDGTSAGDYSIWYFYSKGEIYIDLSYYYYEGDYIVDVYVYLLKEGDLGLGGGSSGGSGDNETGSGNTNTHTYTEFSADDKNLFHIGYVYFFLLKNLSNKYMAVAKIIA